MSLSLERLRSDGALTPVGLNLARLDFTPEDYEALGFLFGQFHKWAESELKWAIGDYLLEGERRYGQEAYQLQEALGISEERRRQYVRVAECIPLLRRRPELKWTHHRVVAALEPAEQDEWLEKAIENGWKSGELQEHRKPEGKTQVVVEEVIRAANEVVDEAHLSPSALKYTIPSEPVDGLREALGRSE